jgi:predicted dehydrogenase
MIKVGLLGFGFMGTTHYHIYQNMPGVKVKMIFDLDPEKIKTHKLTTGNIESTGQKTDLTDVNITDNPEDVIDSHSIDMIDICLPTFMHSDYTVKALNAGKHVLCEKPMALKPEDCDAMLRARDKVNKKLMIAQCIRFWPEYALIKKIITEKKYGEVISAHFKRFSPIPTWSYNDWLLNKEKSGGCLVDMHIHDIDYIVYVFGKPLAVQSFGESNISSSESGVDCMLTRYIYKHSAFIVAESGWHFHNKFPFDMSFRIRCETATIDFDGAREKTLAIYRGNDDVSYAKVSKTTGWDEEIKYFIDRIRKNKPLEISPPEQSKLALQLALAEKESIEKNRSIEI